MNQQSAPPLWIEALEIRHFAGIHNQNAFQLEKLSPGINLIYGPNGCGKSTTAKAIQQLLWPDPKADFSELTGTIQRENSQWKLITRGREVRQLRGSELLDPPDWAAPETRMRYNWSLQNLLQEKDGELARQIAREMAGGIDFQELASSLQWQKKPAAPSGLNKQYLAAERKLREAKASQMALKQESFTLADLKAACEQALARSQQAPLIQLALELCQKQKQAEELQQQLATFHPSTKNLLRDDADELQKNLDQQQQLREELRSLNKQRNALGTGEVDWGTVSEQDFLLGQKQAEQLLNQLEALERSCRETDKEFHRLEAEQQQLYSSIGMHAKAALSLADGFDYPEIQTWIQQIFKQIELQERCKVLGESLSTQDGSTGEIFDMELLRDARRNLEAWLQLKRPAKAASLYGFVCNSLILAGLLIYVILKRLLPWYGMLLILPGIVLQKVFQKKQDLQKQLTLQSEYPQSIPPPPAWEEETVQTHLKELESCIRKTHADALRKVDQHRLADAQQALENVSTGIDTLKQNLQNAGLDLQQDPLWMAHFLQTVKAWRDLRIKTKVAEEQHLAETEKKSGLEIQLRQHLKSWGHRDNALSPQVAVQDLSDRIQKEISRRHQWARLDRDAKHLQQQLTEKEEAIRKRCQRAELAEPDVATLKARVQSISDWEEKYQRSEILKTRISELRQKLDSVSFQLPPDEADLQRELAACTQAAIEERQLREQVSRLQERIAGKQKGREVHEAEEELEACFEALDQARDSQAEILTGMAILDWLQEKCRSRDRSRVLEEANRNLGIFSKGNLQLHLGVNDGSEEFSASVSGHEPQPLNLLSSGERTQLLMAVRLAFLRLNEHAPLPLLVDEALGTSDDLRGEELIRALIEVSKQGRQLFYFTAQLDEVQKWRHVMSEQGVEGHFVDLAALRAQQQPAPLPAPAAEQTDLFDSSRHLNESDAEWAKRLQIPGWHPHQVLEELSLWFLLQDKENLYQQLFARGIHNIGHWMTYDQAGGLTSWVSDADRSFVNRNIEVVRSLRAYWKIGRPPPVSISAVLMSGAVTDKFVDEVSQLVNATQGNAEQLIRDLKDKKVQGFYKQKIVDLENHLLELGYLSDVPALSEHEIKAKVLSNPGAAALTAEQWLRLCDLFFANAPSI